MRPVDADELVMFPYSERSGTEDQIAEWIEQAGLSEDDTADRARELCWKVIAGCVNVVKTQPTITPQNEWVSVEERLPEDDTSEYKAQIAVLVLTDRESIKIKKRTYHPGRLYYGKFYPERWDWGTFNDDRITHWMPLPALPDRRPPERQEGT